MGFPLKQLQLTRPCGQAEQFCSSEASSYAAICFPCLPFFLFLSFLSKPFLVQLRVVMAIYGKTPTVDVERPGHSRTTLISLNLHAKKKKKKKKRKTTVETFDGIN